jgi:HK97 family phage portal protein
MTVLQTVDGELLKTASPPSQGKSRVVVSEGPGSVPLETRRVTYEMIAEINPTVYAVLTKLVHQIATLPFRVYKGDRHGEREEVKDDHPLRELLDRPAPRCAPSDWKEWLVRPFYVHGNGLVAKWRGPEGDGLPTALLPVVWPLASAWSTIGGPVEWWTTVQTGTSRYFSVEDSIHLRWGSSNVNGLGVSPLKSLATTIRLDDSARTFQQSSFANGGRPGSTLIPPENFTYKAGQREELREEIKRRFGGSQNAFDVALLAPGFDWKTVAFSPVEAEIIAARNINREEIAMVYDLSGPMINDLTHGTYSNVEQLHRMLYVTTLRPPIRRLEETLDAQLIDCEEEWSEEELFIECDLSEVLRGNRREEIDAFAEAYTNGLMTLNQCAEGLGLPRFDHPLADIPNISTNNMTPATHVEEAHAKAQAAGDQAALDMNTGTDPAARASADELKPNPGKQVLPRKVASMPEGPESGA